MSIATVQLVAERFLKQNEPGVLALKGAWGVGKTYAWNHLVAQLAGGIWPQTYSYVSLFGLSSLSSLRTAILANSQPATTVGKPLTFDSINQNWSRFGLAKIGQLWSRIGGAQGGQVLKGVSVAFDALAPLLIRDTVVCLDDFERVAGITHEELMGFISTLKETSHCKVVIILNDAKLPAENAYSTYREKVIDIELQFRPTIEEALGWGLPADLWERERIKACALALDIRNVRILKKITGVAKLLEPILKNLHADVIEAAIRSTVLLTWSYFDKSGDVPSIEFVRSFNSISAELRKKKNKPTPQEAAWEAAIRDYRFMPFSDIDLAVLNVIEHGYTEESGLEEEASKLDTMYKDGDKEKVFREAWSLFHDSFGDNETELVAALCDGLRKAVHQVAPSNLSGTAALLRELGHPQEADELISFYMKERGDEAELFDLAHNPFATHVTDPPTREAFKKQTQLLAKAIPLRQAAETIAVAGGWSIEETRALEAASADDLYELFKGPLSVPLHKVVQACLRQSNPPNAVAERATEALRKIAGESKVDAIRMRRYGIELSANDAAEDW